VPSFVMVVGLLLFLLFVFVLFGLLWELALVVIMDQSKFFVLEKLVANVDVKKEVFVV